MGGFVGLDAVSCPQAMISRPVVAGSLAGFLFGDPSGGLVVGVLLEILTLRQLPVGAARYWDTGPAAVSAAAVVAGAGGAGGTAGGYVVALALGVVVGWAGSWTVNFQRQVNSRIVGSLGDGELAPRKLEARHLACMSLDFLRAAGLTAASLLIALGLARPLAERVDPVEAIAAALLFTAAALALGAGVGTVERGRSVQVSFVVGFALSALLIVWLR